MFIAEEMDRAFLKKSKLNEIPAISQTIAITVSKYVRNRQLHHPIPVEESLESFCIPELLVNPWTFVIVRWQNDMREANGSFDLEVLGYIRSSDLLWRLQKLSDKGERLLWRNSFLQQAPIGLYRGNRQPLEHAGDYLAKADHNPLNAVFERCTITLEQTEAALQNRMHLFHLLNNLKQDFFKRRRSDRPLFWWESLDRLGLGSSSDKAQLQQKHADLLYLQTPSAMLEDTLSFRACTKFATMSRDRVELINTWLNCEELLLRFRLQTCWNAQLLMTWARAVSEFLKSDDEKKSGEYSLRFGYDWQWMSINKIGSNEVRDQLRTLHPTATSWLIIPFEQALDLVRNRRVCLYRGSAYVPITMIVDLVCADFRHSLHETVVRNNREPIPAKPAVNEDSRFYRLWQNWRASWATVSGFDSDGKSVASKGLFPRNEYNSALQFLMSKDQRVPQCQSAIVRAFHGPDHPGRWAIGSFAQGIGVTEVQIKNVFAGKFRAKFTAKGRTNTDAEVKQALADIAWNWKKKNKGPSCMTLITARRCPHYDRLHKADPATATVHRAMEICRSKVLNANQLASLNKKNNLPTSPLQLMHLAFSE